MNRPTKHHPLYGEIPLVERRSRGSDGREYVWLEYDPEFQPTLPRGAVRGSVWKQQYCTAHNAPKYFYVDEEKTCVQCRERFTFRAAEQKFWYETLKFNFGSSAIRCATCRKRKRSEGALREQIAAALEQLASRPRDPHALLELASATVLYRERTGQGNLDRAVSACRKAHEEWPASPEPLFWEGKCHLLAGRATRAKACFAALVAQSETRKGPNKLLAEARSLLEVIATTARRS